MRIIFKSGRCTTRHFKIPSRKSVKTCLSCTSSTTMKSYWLRVGSVCICLNKTPSVRNKIFVNRVRVFSNRTLITVATFVGIKQTNDWVMEKSEIGNWAVVIVFFSITITITITLIVSNCNWKFLKWNILVIE